MHLEKRILVTGGAGFLGSHLCARLIAERAQVLCVDNFFTGARRNLEPLLDHKVRVTSRYNSPVCACRRERDACARSASGNAGLL